MMKKRGLLRTVAIFFMVLTMIISCTVVSYAVNVIPDVGKVLYSDDFSGTALDSRIVSTVTNSSGASTGTVGISTDKSLEIWKDPNNTDWVGADIYINEDKSGVNSGELVTQFTLTRFSSMPTIICRMCAADNSEITRMYWGAKDVNSRYTCSDTKGANGAKETLTSVGKNTTKMTVTTYYNFDNQTISMWFNGTLVFEDKYPYRAAADGLAYIRIYTQQASAKFYVDDFVCYNLEEGNDEELVRLDSDSLTYESIFSASEVTTGVIGSDIELPDLGVNGSEITWESSDEAFISTDGKVTLADERYAVLPEVTLTATISRAEISEKKSFVVKVSRAPVPPQVNEIGDVIYNEDFSKSELDSRIITTTTDGNGISTGTVTVAVDETLEIWKDPANTTWVGADIYVNKDKSGVDSGELVTQFTLRRFSALPIIICRMCSVENQEITRMYWGNKDANSRITYSETKGTDYTTQRYTTIGKTATSIKVTTYYNFDNQTISMWFDDTLVFENKYPCKAAADNLAYLRIYTEQGSARFYVDDIKVYRPSKAGVTAHQRTIDGEPAENLVGGKTVDTIISVARDDAGSVQVFSVLYSEEGKMEKVALDNLTFEAAGEKISKSLSIELPDNVDGYTLKTIVTDNMKPFKWIYDNTPLIPFAEN